MNPADFQEIQRERHQEEADLAEAVGAEPENDELTEAEKLDAKINDEEDQKLQAALSCGPQCASSVLATRYAKILRQERLLAMAASALESMEKETLAFRLPSAGANVQRSAAIRRQIDEERGNKA